MAPGPITRIMVMGPPGSGKSTLARALAERLDHLRHLHLKEPDAAAREVWREARDVWLPFADRTHPDLARRYAWWTRKFTKRYD